MDVFRGKDAINELICGGVRAPVPVLWHGRKFDAAGGRASSVPQEPGGWVISYCPDIWVAQEDCPDITDWDGVKGTSITVSGTRHIIRQAFPCSGGRFNDFTLSCEGVVVFLLDPAREGAQ